MQIEKYPSERKILIIRYNTKGLKEILDVIYIYNKVDIAVSTIFIFTPYQVQYGSLVKSKCLLKWERINIA